MEPNQTKTKLIEPKSTHVINLFAGGGAGKTTTAADLFAEMKHLRLHVELVREYIKDWAWTGRECTAYDQVYVFGKQAQRESIYYHNLDYLVTDSPLILSAFYEQHVFHNSIIAPAVFNFLEFAKSQNIVYHNFFLKRLKKFDTRGRYQTEEQARDVDNLLKTFLDDNKISYVELNENNDRERPNLILNHLGLNK